MEKETLIESIKSRAFLAGLPVYELCNRAGIAPSTFYRWKKHPGTMTARAYRKLTDALDAMENAQ
jgi:Transposase